MAKYNNTGLFKTIDGKLIRPWRKIEQEALQTAKFTAKTEEKGSRVPKQPQKNNPEIPVKWDNMSKDELLDYTAIHRLEADYKDSVKKLKQIVKKHMEGEQ